MSDVVLTKEVKIQFTVGYVASMSEGVGYEFRKLSKLVTRLVIIAS